MADLTLEQSEARRVQSEHEAESLKAQVAAERERADKAEGMGQLRDSLQSGAEIAALRRELAALKREHAETRGKVEESYGENGVAVHDGVAHGMGSGSGPAAQAERLATTRLYVSIFGQVYQGDVPIANLTAAGP